MLVEGAALAHFLWLKPVDTPGKRHAYDSTIKSCQGRLILLESMPCSGIYERWSGFNLQTSQQGAEQQCGVIGTALSLRQHHFWCDWARYQIAPSSDFILNKTHCRQ